MTGSGEELANALANRGEPRDEFGEMLRALVRKDVIDGVPVCSSTIGGLMAKYAGALAEQLSSALESSAEDGEQ